MTSEAPPRSPANLVGSAPLVVAVSFGPRFAGAGHREGPAEMVDFDTDLVLHDV
jgi:hypothetical protein